MFPTDLDNGSGLGANVAPTTRRLDEHRDTPTTAATPVVLPITKAIFWLAAATFVALLVHRAALRRKRS